MSNHILTREQYEYLLEQNYQLAKLEIEARTEPLTLTSNTFFKLDATEEVDDTYFLECDDDWKLPFPFGWIAQEEHFTGEPEQDYYLDYIIEVKYD